MDLREAKATSKLLHALAGDTTLDPVAELTAAVIETLSYCAGGALQVTAVLSPTGLRTAVVATSPRTNPSKHGTTGGHP